MNVLKRLLGLALTTGVIVGLLFSWTQRQAIYDWWVLKNYSPPAAVSQLAEATTMTNEGQRIFYVAQPLIVNEQEFNSACRPESTIVLGCYISGRGIYLYDIQDERLSGVKEVTAAHEMLHAAYERLSKSEKDKIDILTNQAYERLDNPRIINNIAEYRKRDASVVPNELHSILATEVRRLSPELEEYYKQYFSNRGVIVDFSERYEKEFQRRRDQVASIDKELGELKIVIEAGQNELNLQYDALVAEKVRLDELLAAGETTEYNARVPTFNQQVRSYNSSVAKVQSQIDRHNTLVKQRNALAVEVQDLVDSIDSRPQSF